MLSRLDPKLDVVFKILFASPANRDLLISLLTAVLLPKEPIVSAEVLNPDLTKDLIDQKGAVLDLRVKLEDGTEVDVEMQARHDTALRSRALYYWARMYGAQLSPGRDYQDLKPCIVIFILKSAELPGQRFHSTLEVQEIHSGEHFSDQLQLHFVELPNLPQSNEDKEVLLAEWGRFFVARSEEEYDELARRNPVMQKAKGALDFLSAEPNVQEIARARELGEYAYASGLRGAHKEGREEGLEEGLKEGLEEGHRKGRLEGLAEAARNMLASGLSSEQVLAILKIDPTDLDLDPDPDHDHDDPSPHS